MRLLVLATLCSLVVQTKQTKWQEIGKTGSGIRCLVDPKSVKKDTAGIITATLRVAFVKPVARLTVRSHRHARWRCSIAGSRWWR